jgi:very-short-patch-repair endonuclease
MILRTRTAERELQSAKRTQARRMRRDPVYVERLFWTHIRDRKLAGFKFKRQHPIGSYIADFVCLEQKLIVELDGGIHRLKAESDAVRDAVLQTQGYRVLRFTNAEVLGDVPTVLMIIRHALQSAAPSPQPSPPLRGGEGVQELKPI